MRASQTAPCSFKAFAREGQVFVCSVARLVERNFQDLTSIGFASSPFQRCAFLGFRATVHHGTRSVHVISLRSPTSVKARIWLFHISKAMRTSFVYVLRL